jgi:hypothetical protein
MRQVFDRGTNLGEVRDIIETTARNLELRRSSTATNTDWFNAFAFPVASVNLDPSKAGHLYVAYADRGTNVNDRADIFFVYSTDGGTNWVDRQRINTDSTTNDQWMPVLTAKPDGTQLFFGWYDRRGDTNNGLMEVYGRFETIELDGTVTLTNTSDLRISTTSFPMVFVGTRDEVEPLYRNPGYYDPVYPPGAVNLHWWYPEWEADTSGMGGIHHTGDPGTYEKHVGEYNGVFSDEDSVYLTWTDYRLPAVGTLVPREQSDVRFIRLPWR